MHDTAGTLQPGIPCRFPVRNRYAATVILCLMVLAGAAAPVGGAQAMGGADAEQAFRAWIVAGEAGSVPVVEDDALLADLVASPPAFHGDLGAYYGSFLDHPGQSAALGPVIAALREGAPGTDDDLRRAVSLVQQLPYRHSGGAAQYPYVTLMEGGDCDDKALLMAYLLRELGYGVALLYFDDERHMAVGIRCPPGYAYRNCGYFFVEPSQPCIPGDAGGDYPEFGTLASAPEVLPVIAGKSFVTAAKEAEDARTWQDIRDRVREGGIGAGVYATWLSLAAAYGLPTA